MNHTAGPMEAAREQWWDGVCQKGDPLHRPNLSYEAFRAGWEASGSINAELLEALKDAEIALLNCIPVKPYPGDGPLVAIRAAIAKAEAR